MMLCYLKGLLVYHASSDQSDKSGKTSKQSQLINTLVKPNCHFCWEYLSLLLVTQGRYLLKALHRTQKKKRQN